MWRFPFYNLLQYSAPCNFIYRYQFDKKFAIILINYCYRDLRLPLFPDAF